MTPSRIFTGASAGEELNLLTRALSTDTPGREALWCAAATDDSSAQARLHRALLQSVPGHSGYDPAAAEASLRGLLNRDLSPDQEALARFRLAQLGVEKNALRAAGECRDEVAVLKKRMADVVDIEKQLSKGH